jgi:hypothetical protein
MEFTRKKKRGQHSKVRRTFLSEDGYRIVWRKEVCGVRVPPRFQACVRSILPNGWEVWDFVNRARPVIKTMKAAQEECAKHKRLWLRACEATGVRELRELFGGKIPSGMPLWATKKANRKVYALVMDSRPAKYREDDECESPPARPETSETPPTRTAGSAEPISDPVSNVTGEDGTTSTRRTRLEDTGTAELSPAEPAAAAEKEPERPSPGRTARRLPSSAKRKMSTGGASSSAKKRSKSSAKKKSKRSGS